MFVGGALLQEILAAAAWQISSFKLSDFAWGFLSFALEIERVTWSFNCPADNKGVFLAFEYFHLIAHSFTGKFWGITMSILYESSIPSSKTFCWKTDVFYFSPSWEQIINSDRSVFLSIDSVSSHRYSSDVQSSTFFIKGANTGHVSFVRCVSGPTKCVFQIIALLKTVILVWHSVIVSTIHPLCARSSSEVNTKPSRSSFLKSVSFSEPSVFFRVALGKRRHSLLVLILNICKISVVPNVVVIIPLYVRCVLGRGVFHLSTSRPL